MGRVLGKLRRGFIDVDIEVTERVRVDDIIEQISDEYILDEAKERGLLSKPKPMEITRETISDYFGKSRYTPLPELMKLLQEKLESE